MTAGRAAVVGGVAFVALAVLVATGAVEGLDRYAVVHWMPWREPPHHELVRIRTVFVPDTRWTTAGSVVALLTYPASPFVSALAVLACAWLMHRRGERTGARALVVLWVVADVLEVTGKLAVAREPIRDAFRHSYPSGHTVRACVVAAAVAAVWHRVHLLVALWAVVAVPIALVVIGDHTPTDVVGGLLLALCLLAACVSALRTRGA